MRLDQSGDGQKLDKKRLTPARSSVGGLPFDLASDRLTRGSSLHGDHLDTVLEHVMQVIIALRCDPISLRRAKNSSRERALTFDAS